MKDSWTKKLDLSMLDPGNQGCTLKRDRDRWIFETSRSRKDIETALEGKDWSKLSFTEFCSTCSYFHELAHVQAVETAYSIEIPPPIKLGRVFFAEASRVLSHLRYVAVTCQNAGSPSYLPIFRARRMFLDQIHSFTGEPRLPRNKIGGLLFDFGAANGISKIRELIDVLSEKIVFWLSSLPEQRSMARLDSIEIITAEECHDHLTTGPLAKACGIPSDVRLKDPNGMYSLFVNFKPVIFDSSVATAYDSIAIRFEEVIDSLRLMNGALKALDSMTWQNTAITRPETEQLEGEMMYRIETPSGELLHYFLADNKPGPSYYRYLPPFLLNRPSMVHCLDKRPITNAAVIIHCFDLCMACGG
ncbi:MAG: hypothetical protein ACFFD4_27660 [Candidatus Odinarchaeota archaeon]